MGAQGEDAVVEFLDGVVDLDDIVLGDQIVPARKTLVDLDHLPWIVSVKEEKDMAS